MNRLPPNLIRDWSEEDKQVAVDAIAEFVQIWFYWGFLAGVSTMVIVMAAVILANR